MEARVREARGPRPPHSVSRTTFFTPKRLAWLRFGLTALTFIAIAWYVHSRPRIEFSRLNLRWEYLAWAAACLPPMLYLRARKWRILLRGASADVTLPQAFRSYLGAMALGLVTPGRVGEFSRGLYLPQPALQGWRSAGLVIIDNWLDFLAVLAWSCLGLFAWLGPKGLALGCVAALILAPIPFWLRAAGRVASLLPSRWGFRSSAKAALEAGMDVTLKDYAGAYGCALLAYGFEWLQIAFLLEFLAPSIPEPWHLAGMMALVSLANTFQVTMAGMGVREGMAMLLLAREGVGAEVALIGAFLQSALTLILPALAGLAVKPVALYSGSEAPA
jgi:uncharacterized membrane protein YbhN (UPF0104 family)